MKRTDRNLLNGILADRGQEDFRRSSLEFGLNAIRQKRRTRQIARTCALVGLPALAALLMLWYQDSNNWVSQHSISSAPAVPIPSSNSDLKIINDEQLFALFPDRALALVGKPGHQQLVFLETEPSPLTR